MQLDPQTAELANGTVAYGDYDGHNNIILVADGPVNNERQVTCIRKLQNDTTKIEFESYGGAMSPWSDRQQILDNWFGGDASKAFVVEIDSNPEDWMQDVLDNAILPS